MGEGIEREFKLCIPDEDARQRLLDELGPGATHTARQVNHYFDSARNTLRLARIALRLREEDGRFTLTLKGDTAGGDTAGGDTAESETVLAETGTPASTLTTRTEEEREIEPSEARSILEGRLSPLEILAHGELAEAPLIRRAQALLATEALVWLGSFENERTRVGPLVYPRGSRQPALLFEFDRTRFPGGLVELELEVELPPEADAPATERALEALFRSVALTPTSAAPKVARFLQILDASRAGE
jgi:uncharacterized protein YjbK